MTALPALGSGSPWWACGYLASTGPVSVWATGWLRDGDLHVPTGQASLTEGDVPSARDAGHTPPSLTGSAFRRRSSS